MKVNGCDCSIVIKTSHHEFDVPYSEETIREVGSLLQEEASIEGNGTCKAIKKKRGVTGCIITPLTIENTPLLLYLAMGSAGKPVFISETKNLYGYELNLIPLENTDYFDLIQDRENERIVFDGCRVQGFELRFEREQAVKLKLDITGERSGRGYLLENVTEREQGERFNSNFVEYRINNQPFENIYGFTISVKKDGGTKTEIWIRRALNKGSDLPENIENLKITARLLRDKYEYRHYGVFSITLKRLIKISDETNVNSSDAVIGPLRYYVAGTVDTEVFSSGEYIA